MQINATHLPTVVYVGLELLGEGGRADEEEDDRQEAGEVEDGRHDQLLLYVCAIQRIASGGVTVAWMHRGGSVETTDSTGLDRERER